MKPQERQLWQDMVDHAYEQFLAYFPREHGVEAVAEDLVAVFDEVFEEVQGGGP